MKSKWDTTAIFACEYLSTEDQHGDPAFELVIEIHSKGEANDTGRGANDPDNYYDEDRELIVAYMVMQPDNKRIELPKEVQQLLYDQMARDADPSDLIWKEDCRR